MFEGVLLLLCNCCTMCCYVSAVLGCARAVVVCLCCCVCVCLLFVAVWLCGVCLLSCVCDFPAVFVFSLCC